MERPTGDQEQAVSLQQNAVLDYLKTRATRLVYLGPAIFAAGVLLLAGHVFGTLGVILGIIGVIGGPSFTWNGVAWLKLLPRARESGKEVPIEVGLEVNVRRGYAGIRYTTALLWPMNPDQDGRPLARFNATMHWAKPRYMAVSKMPAQVHGAPTPGAAVIVSCAQGVVIGRIQWSRFGDNQAARPMPAFMRLLFKERRLRSP